VLGLRRFTPERRRYHHNAGDASHETANDIDPPKYEPDTPAGLKRACVETICTGQGCSRQAGEQQVSVPAKEAFRSAHHGNFDASIVHRRAMMHGGAQTHQLSFVTGYPLPRPIAGLRSGCDISICLGTNSGTSANSTLTPVLEGESLDCLWAQIHSDVLGQFLCSRLVD
jgi:hypothetical protein